MPSFRVVDRWLEFLAAVCSGDLFFCSYENALWIDRRTCQQFLHAVEYFEANHHTTIKITSLGVVATTMSHAAEEACTQRLAAGRGDGYRLAASSLQLDRGTGSGPAC